MKKFNPRGRNRSGPDCKWNPSDILTCFPTQPDSALSIGRVAEIAFERLGMPYSTFHRYKTQLTNNGAVISRAGLWWRDIGVIIEQDDNDSPPAVKKAMKQPVREQTWLPQELDHALEAFPIGQDAAREMDEVKYFARKDSGIHFLTFISLRRELEKAGAIAKCERGWYRRSDYRWMDAQKIERVSADVPCRLPPKQPPAANVRLSAMNEAAREAFNDLCDAIKELLSRLPAEQPAPTLTDEDHFA